MPNRKVRNRRLNHSFLICREWEVRRVACADLGQVGLRWA